MRGLDRTMFAGLEGARHAWVRFRVVNFCVLAGSQHISTGVAINTVAVSISEFFPKRIFVLGDTTRNQRGKG